MLHPTRSAPRQAKGETDGRPAQHDPDRFDPREEKDDEGHERHGGGKRIERTAGAGRKEDGDSEDDGEIQDDSHDGRSYSFHRGGEAGKRLEGVHVRSPQEYEYEAGE